MKISVYIATSLDGYIARKNGDLDWLENFNTDGEDYGYNAFVETVDVLVMGRKSYDKVLTFGDWPYGEQRVIILSNSLKEVPKEIAETVSIMAGSPKEIAFRLTEEGVEHVYLDGGETIQRFLKAGLVDEMIITTIPMLIGAGISLFGEIEQDILFEHVKTKSYPTGLVQNWYRR